MLLKNNER